MAAAKIVGSPLRIIVLGYVIRGPLGGLVWHHLQYVVGLTKLGHDVYFLEDSDDYPSCYDPNRHVTDTDPTYGLAFAAHAFSGVGLRDRWAYYDAHENRWHGPLANRARELCSTADVVLNLSGVNPLRDWMLDVPVRVFVDTDPVFTQVRHLTEPKSRKRANDHTAFFTFGENFGGLDCTIPDDGYPWLPTRQPICLDAWPLTAGPEEGLFTTVMQWDSYAVRTYQGISFGMKSEAFEPYFNLPDKAGYQFELALGSPTAPRDLLRNCGWHLRDPLEVTRDPWTYQRYIQESKAEFSVAKQGYVMTRCGWFSERSAAYLASGRPVLVQDTGFTDWLEAGRGVLAFGSPQEAIEGVEKINGDYAMHCHHARHICAAYFDARQVLGQLLESVTGQASLPDGCLPGPMEDATKK
jgi:hypothetical protein